MAALLVQSLAVPLKQYVVKHTGFTTATSSLSVGSTRVGNNIIISATGVDLDSKAIAANSNPNTDTLTIAGSNVQATNNASLSATGDINLLASQNTSQLESKHIIAL